MSEKNHKKTNGAMKKGVAYWQTDWMKKVMSNGHNAQAKLIFMRIASFGESGCWMNNETLHEEFNRSDRTIRRAISSLWSKGDIIIMGWNGHGRKIYAAGHPNVKPEIKRQFFEYKAKGKVSTIEDWRKKVRMRLRPIEELPPEAEHKVKGLDYFRTRQSKPNE